MTETFVAPWQDISTLCRNICVSENTVDAWVKQGLLPPPRRRGGKRLWKWSEVERYLENGGADVSVSPDALADRIREATRNAVTAKNH
jgi:predicted site-specific integrase-resolvase